MEENKEKRKTATLLRYQDMYNEFSEHEGALSGGVDALRNTRYDVVLAPTDAKAKGNKGVYVSRESKDLRERLR